MNYDNFLNEWLGKQVTAYEGECVALVAQYCTENGKPIAYANAKDWFNNPVLADAFDFITNDPNDPSQLPGRGNIIIWNGDLPGSGGCGHIAIFDEVLPAEQFQSFDQNWGGAEAHFQSHTWSFILGWLVPKEPPVIPPHPDPAPANPPPAPEPVPEPTPVSEPVPAPEPPAPAPTPVVIPVISEPPVEPAPTTTQTPPQTTALPPHKISSRGWLSLVVFLKKLIKVLTLRKEK